MFVSDATWTALIMAIPATIASLTGLFVAFKGLKKVDDLKKNTDGMHSELMTLSERANIAEGKAAGVAAERDRPASSQVPESLQTQMDKIETTVSEGAATGLRNEAAALVVAEDLAAAHVRAIEAPSSEHGAAADAAVLNPSKETEEVK